MAFQDQGELHTDYSWNVLLNMACRSRFPRFNSDLRVSKQCSGKGGVRLCPRPCKLERRDSSIARSSYVGYSAFVLCLSKSFSQLVHWINGLRRIERRLPLKPLRTVPFDFLRMQVITNQNLRRARYLRLPSGAPRQSLPISSALRSGLRSSPSITSARTTTLTPSLLPDDKSEKASTVPEDDEMSNAGSSDVGRRRPLALRMTKLTTTRPTLTNTVVSREGGADIWREMRRAQRRPPSEQA